jgi:3-oxoacyl-[acyl-carrier protein] reductase
MIADHEFRRCRRLLETWSVDPLPPRRVLVTGVGRRAGIAASIADRLREDAWQVVTTGWRSYDARMDWGADDQPLADHDVDFTDPDAPDQLFRVLAGDGPITAMVMCHAESVDSDIHTTTVESFDRHFAVNARSTWLLIRAFARQFPADAAGAGRIVAMTSDHTAFNLPYGASKGALDRIVIAAATELAQLGITANVVNPGPNDTGWMDDEIREAVLRHNAQPRIGTPTDTANLVSFLLSDEGGWINAQILHSDGGIKRG